MERVEAELNPKIIARELANAHPEQILAKFHEITSFPGSASLARKGLVAVEALHDPNLYDRAVLCGIYGKCLNVIHSNGYSQISISTQKTRPFDWKKQTNQFDVLYCRGAGQVWRDAPQLFDQIFPAEPPEKKNEDFIPIRAAGILCRSISIIQNRKFRCTGNEQDKDEMDELVSLMNEGVEDFTDLLLATSEQLKKVENISESSAHNFFGTLTWIYSNTGRTPEVDVDIVHKLAALHPHKLSNDDMEAIAFLKVKALNKIAHSKPLDIQAPKPKI